LAADQKVREELIHRIILVCALAGILGVPAFGQGVDPLLGTWRLNVEKSTSTLGLPKSLILTVSGEGQSRTLVAEGVNAQNQSYKYAYQYVYDGQPHPTTGDPNIDSSAYSRVGNIVNVVRFKNGKPVDIGQAILIPGKTYTYTHDYELNGQLGHEVLAYDRQ
jgi:hypothetical protein